MVESRMPVAAAFVEELRRKIAAIEARPLVVPVGAVPGDGPRRAGEVRSAVPLGVAEIDHRLGGGLARGDLHEVAGAAPRQEGAAAGFALALAARAMAAGSGVLLWVQQAMSAHEAGAPYGPGLALFGLNPGRLLIVRAGNAPDTLWAAEEGLSCRALALVLAELWDARSFSLIASRRLRLAAQASGVPALVLRAPGADAPSAAATRWRVAAHPGNAADLPAHALGRPRWTIALDKNRGGRLGAWTVEWKSDAYRFLLSSPHSGAMAAAPFDRPDRAGPAARRAG